MTPMIDVLLVLIIIFMVITPLTPVGLRTLVSQPPDAAEHESSDIVLTVERDGSVRLNAECIELLALHGRLSQIYQVRGDAVLFVRGDKRLEFRQIAAVIDVAKGAGLQRVALMTH